MFIPRRCGHSTYTGEVVKGTPMGTMPVITSCNAPPTEYVQWKSLSKVITTHRCADHIEAAREKVSHKLA